MSIILNPLNHTPVVNIFYTSMLESNLIKDNNFFQKVKQAHLTIFPGRNCRGVRAISLHKFVAQKVFSIVLILVLYIGSTGDRRRCPHAPAPGDVSPAGDVLCRVVRGTTGHGHH